MKTLHFTKAEGAQNDFVILDDRKALIPADDRSQLSRTLCHRRRGVGADGTIFIDRSESYDFAMAFYNPDGSTGSMCGNGGRCAALYAYVHKIAPQSMKFEALDRPYSAVVTDSGIRLYFPPPKALRRNFQLSLEDSIIPIHYVDTGAPHVVVFANEITGREIVPLSHLDVNIIGALIRDHPEFRPAGTNVNFIEIQSNGLVHIRTFEKGVEAETESCGTGTIAAAIIANTLRDIQPPIRVCTHGNDILTVGFVQNDDFDPKHLSAESYGRGLYLEGSANLVFNGIAILDSNADRFHLRAQQKTIA